MREFSSIASLLTAVGLALLTGCATTPQITVRSDVLDPAAARSRSVAVMSDFYMENPAEADRLAQQLRQTLKEQGFKVGSSEMDADLIVVPTLARSEKTVPVRVAPRQSLISSSFGQPGMQVGSGDFGGVGFPTTPYQQPKIGLMISAVTRQNWLQAASAGEEVPRVWRVTAVAATSQNSARDVTPLLLEAAGPDLGKISNLGSQPEAASR